MELAIWILSAVVVVLFIWLLVNNAVGNRTIKTLEHDLEHEKRWREYDNEAHKETNKNQGKRLQEHSDTFVALSTLLPGPYALLSVEEVDHWSGDMVRKWDRSKILRLAKRVKSESKNGADDKVIKKLEAFGK